MFSDKHLNQLMTMHSSLDCLIIRHFHFVFFLLNVIFVSVFIMVI